MAEELTVVEEQPRRRRTVIDRDDDLLTLDEVAAWFKCTKRTVVQLVTAGKLRSTKVGWLRRVKRSWANDYLERVKG
jgi:excisionase family DNA binding protein